MKPTLKTIYLVLALSLSACSPYSANTVGIRQSLTAGDYGGAQSAIDKAVHGPSKLLYFLESGLVAHYEGEYVRSNNLLERAERIADELFTRSLSRELAALVTSDETRDYRGETHELIAIHYYRALNYWYLDLPEDALVECRKANLKLAQFSGHLESATYKNDAFIHYLTALFYETEGEYNDAYISLKDAEAAYRTYATTFGISAPENLKDDLARVERELGYASASLTALPVPAAGSGELVVFSELGFIPRLSQEELNLPIYKSDLNRVRDGKVRDVSRHVRRRHRRHRHQTEVDYWLRVALPRFESASSPVGRVRIVSGSQTTTPALAQDFEGIAQRNLDERSDTIFLRTVARALLKFAATKAAEKKSEWLGWLVNAFTASTEKADTRSWVTLPRAIRVGRLNLPPGSHMIRIQSLGPSGHVIREETREVTIVPGKRTYINHRLYS